MANLKTFFHFKQPLGRNFAHLVFWLIILQAIGLQFNWIDLSHNDEQFLVFMCALSGVSMLVPWFANSYVKKVRQKLSLSQLNKIEFSIALMLVLGWVGALGLYRAEIGYDTFVHFLNSTLVAVISFILLHAIVTKNKVTIITTLTVVFLAVLLLGIITELFEWSVDSLIGTTMYGELGEPTDTIKDMVANMTGFIVGTIYATKNKNWLLG